jgi:putative protease
MPKKKVVKKAKAKPKTKAAKKPTKPKATKAAKPIGVVTHFYTEIKVAIVKFKQPVKVGVELQFKGATTDFKEKIKSMQYDHKPLKIAPKGKQIGIKVKKRVREGDEVYMG